MQFENVSEVVEEFYFKAVNERLSSNWTLLAIVPGFNPTTGHASTCYVLGKFMSTADKAAKLVRANREGGNGNEFLNNAG
jgi:hypothetical protein